MPEADVVKPGYKTSEFWLSVAGMVVGAVLGAGLPEDNIVMKVAGLAGSVLIALGYQVNRSWVKK